MPIYHRLKVYTAYEYLEQRFDVKTRALAAFLFLIQRGLAAGLTIYAPALILSVILGWDMRVTILRDRRRWWSSTPPPAARGGEPGPRCSRQRSSWSAWSRRFVALVASLPADVSFVDALRVAGGRAGSTRSTASFSLTNRYNLWSGLIGGFFLQLSYFGTDQSQVQRYLTGQSVAQSRLGLLFNGLVKIPMQFVILFLGVMVFVFYLFVPPPMFFNPVQTAKARGSADGGRFAALEERYRVAVGVRERHARGLVSA